LNNPSKYCKIIILQLDCESAMGLKEVTLKFGHHFMHATVVQLNSAMHKRQTGKAKKKKVYIIL
jgi:hypothetical protein